MRLFPHIIFSASLLARDDSASALRYPNNVMLTPAQPSNNANTLVDFTAVTADLAKIAQTHEGRESEMRTAVAQRLKIALAEGRKVAEELLLKDRHGRHCAERLCHLQDE